MKAEFTIALSAIMLGAAFVSGSAIQAHVDRKAIVSARENEMQANGLEDECKASHPFTEALEERENGDYRLMVYGGRRLVCEERDVRIVRQPDAANALVLECAH